MDFVNLSPDSERLLDKIVSAGNPTQFLSDSFDNIASEEDDELRSKIRELTQAGYISIPMWADNRPYHVTVNNSAKMYNERLAEHEKMVECVAQKATEVVALPSQKEKSTFYEKHPIICGFLISLAAGIVLLFSFWMDIVRYMENLFG